jgi:nucleotide-binding universal stress UspA family protein
VALTTEPARILHFVAGSEVQNKSGRLWQYGSGKLIRADRTLESGGGAVKMLDRILAAIDPSREGTRALRMAIELAREIGADLKVIVVLKPLPACFSFAVSALFAGVWKQSQLKKCIDLETQARQQMTRAGLYPDAELVSGSEVFTILKCAKQFQADLIVMGMRNRTIVTDRITQDVAERSPCAVLGVP